MLTSSFFFLLLLFCFAYLGSFPNTSRSGFIFIWVVSLTHPILASYLLGEFLLHSPCWLLRFVVVVFGLPGDLLLHIPFSLHFYLGSPLTHPVLASFLFFSSFFQGSFSYTYRAGLSFIGGICLTHSVLAPSLCGEFLLHIPYCFRFYLEFLLHNPC